LAGAVVCGLVRAEVGPAGIGESNILTMLALAVVQAQSGGGGLSLLIMFVPMIAMIYFFLVMPQQRRQKKWQAMLDQLKTGDKVTTSGGLRGVIVALKDDSVHLRVPPDNLRVEVTKASVMQVTTQEEEVKAK
jgi:preprotein translocase subunit YajC